MQAATGTSYAHPAEHVLRPSEQELLDAWRELVEANAAQVARLRETKAPEDFWGEGYSGSIVSLEHPAPQCRLLAALARPEDTWLDIGAGFGGSMLPVANSVTRVTALDPSPGMVEKLRRNISLLGIVNVDVLEPMEWPPDTPLEPHDVCLAAAVIDVVADIGGFLDAMEQHARRLCVALVAELGTGFTPNETFFEALHGEQYIRPPALREFLALLASRRRRFDIQTYPLIWPPEDLETALAERGRKSYLLQEGSEKEARLRQLLVDHYGIGDGWVHLPHPPAGTFAAIVSWEPPGLPS